MAGEEENEFCENYLILKPEEASCFDFVRILCSNELETRDFFNSGSVEESFISFRHRWIVFISVLLQKIFLHLKKPMAAVGAAVEMLLNYPPENGGYRRLFFNLLTGRLVKPDRSSARFISMVGYLDKRWELDKSIRNPTSKYIESMAVMASKLSYENKSFVQSVVNDHWQMEFLEFYHFWNDYEETNTTYATIFRDTTTNPNLIFVSFRGTAPFDSDSWRTDIDISWYQFPGIGKIHGGFMKALGLQKSTGWPKQLSFTNSNQKLYSYYTIREKLKTLIQENEGSKFILTGHSLGGALAILFAGILSIHEEELLLNSLEGVYTFGQPRVGNDEFGEYMKEKMRIYDIKYFRYVYCNDMVPRLPYDDKTFLFKHFGPCLYFNSCYKGKILGEEPNKNYFSLLHVIPKMLNAVYELIQGFILPWTNGVEYKEGWFMRLFRVIALVIPGLIDHFLVNYVNVTRLGKLPPSIYSHGPNQNLKQD